MSTPPSTRLGAAYWRLWTASAISNVGDGVLLAALPLLAARTTHSRLSVSLISTFFSIPWLLLALPAGAVIDRMDRRHVLIAADMFRGALIGGLALVAAFSEVRIWMLWVLAFGLGVGEVFFDSSSQTILPALVPADQFERANGLRYSAEITGNTFAGAPLGSVLFAVAVWLPFGTDAASFVVAAVLAVSLRGSFRSATPPEAGSWRGEISEGVRWLWRHRLLRSLAIALGLTNLAFAAAESTFVLFATQRLGVSTRLFGALIAIVGVASVVAGLVGGWLVGKVGRRFAVLVAAAAPIFTMLAIGAVPVTWWVVAMTALQAMMITVWSIIAVSLRQQMVPDHLFGRVNGVFRWFSWGAMPIGALLGGLVAQRFGLRAPYFFGGAVLAVAYVMVVSRLTGPAIAAATLPRDDPPDEAASSAVEPASDDTPVDMTRDPFDDLF